MKLSCLPVTFFKDIVDGKMTIREWAEMGKKYGLDGIDIGAVLVKAHTPAYLSVYRRELEEVGISITMMTDYPDYTHPDPLQREREEIYLAHDIAVASELGIQFIRVTAGQAHPQTTASDGIRWAIEGLRRSSSIAEKYGVTLVYENHSKTGAWPLPDFSHASEIFLEIADGIKDTGIGINFDTANNLAYGEDPLPVLEAVIDRVVCIHAAETATRGELSPVRLGTGLVPFPEIFRRLKENGFDNWICIEEWANEGEAGVAAAIDYVRKTWANS